MIARQKKLALISVFSVILALSGIGLASYAFYQQNEASLAREDALEERKAALDELAKTK